MGAFAAFAGLAQSTAPAQLIVAMWWAAITLRQSAYLRARSTISASSCWVERALSLCLKRHLCRRADALICRRCLSDGQH
jgi:hypothetical protein